MSSFNKMFSNNANNHKIASADSPAHSNSHQLKPFSDVAVASSTDSNNTINLSNKLSNSFIRTATLPRRFKEKFLSKTLQPDSLPTQMPLAATAPTMAVQPPANPTNDSKETKEKESSSSLLTTTSSSSVQQQQQPSLPNELISNLNKLISKYFKTIKYLEQIINKKKFEIIGSSTTATLESVLDIYNQIHTFNLTDSDKQFKQCRNKINKSLANLIKWSDSILLMPPATQQNTDNYNSNLNKIQEQENSDEQLNAMHETSRKLIKQLNKSIHSLIKYLKMTESDLVKSSMSSFSYSSSSPSLSTLSSLSGTGASSTSSLSISISPQDKASSLSSASSSFNQNSNTNTVSTTTTNTNSMNKLLPNESSSSITNNYHHRIASADDKVSEDNWDYQTKINEQIVDALSTLHPTTTVTRTVDEKAGTTTTQTVTVQKKSPPSLTCSSFSLNSCTSSNGPFSSRYGDNSSIPNSTSSSSYVTQTSTLTKTITTKNSQMSNEFQLASHCPRNSQKSSEQSGLATVNEMNAFFDLDRLVLELSELSGACEPLLSSSSSIQKETTVNNPKSFTNEQCDYLVAQFETFARKFNKFDANTNSTNTACTSIGSTMSRTGTFGLTGEPTSYIKRKTLHTSKVFKHDLDQKLCVIESIISDLKQDDDILHQIGNTKSTDTGLSQLKQIETDLCDHGRILTRLLDHKQANKKDFIETNIVVDEDKPVDELLKSSSDPVRSFMSLFSDTNISSVKKDSTAANKATALAESAKQRERRRSVTLSSSSGSESDSGSLSRSPDRSSFSSIHNNTNNLNRQHDQLPKPVDSVDEEEDDDGNINPMIFGANNLNPQFLLIDDDEDEDEEFEDDYGNNQTDSSDPNQRNSASNIDSLCKKLQEVANFTADDDDINDYKENLMEHLNDTNEDDLKIRKLIDDSISIKSYNLLPFKAQKNEDYQIQNASNIYDVSQVKEEDGNSNSSNSVKSSMLNPSTWSLTFVPPASLPLPKHEPVEVVLGTSIVGENADEAQEEELHDLKSNGKSNLITPAISDSATNQNIEQNVLDLLDVNHLLEYQSASNPSTMSNKSHFNVTMPTNILRGGHIDALIVLATSANTNVSSAVSSSKKQQQQSQTADNQSKGNFLFQEAFLTTYRTIIEPIDLIMKLIYRYRLFSKYASNKNSFKNSSTILGSPKSQLDEKFDLNRLKSNIKNNKMAASAARNSLALLVRVLDDLGNELNEKIIEIFTDFVYELLIDNELQLARLLRKKLLFKLESQQKEKLSNNKLNACISINSIQVKSCGNLDSVDSLPYSLNSLNKRSNQSLLDFKSIDLAQQITLIDLNLFLKIELSEVLLWSTKQNEKHSPNLIKFTEHFNKISYWARSRILEQENIKEREKILIKFLKIMKHLRKFNNFNSYLSILSAVDSGPVQRLDWSKSLIDSVKEFAALIDPKCGFKCLREAVAEAQPPCIPHIGLILQDLTILHIANSDYLPSSNCNFWKRWQQFNILERLRCFRRCNYDFKPDIKIQKFFNNFEDYFGEDAQYTLSEQLKPRSRHY